MRDWWPLGAASKAKRNIFFQADKLRLLHDFISDSRLFVRVVISEWIVKQFFD